MPLYLNHVYTAPFEVFLGIDRSFSITDLGVIISYLMINFLGIILYIPDTFLIQPLFSNLSFQSI